ncbi:MAG: hypothetical protein RI858_03045, partial [Planktomarina sp.]|jgi:hypothetical protein|nr:hypothetical protein [Planktomarina sp.]MDA9100664.1 hypothetical protein [Planktomarina sp.]MDS9950152.1 hypothetical protein [Planktomarina sp.]
MSKMDKLFTQIRSLLLRGAEGLGLLLAVLVLTYLLLGEDSGDYVISVVTNISLFVSAVTPQAIVGVAIVVGVIAYLRGK